MRSTCILAAAFLVLATSPGQAQKSNTRGFMANVHYARTTLKTEGSKETDTGNGGGFRLGWGFSPKFTGYLGFDIAQLIIQSPGVDGDYGLGQFDLGVAYNFASSSRALVPYLELGLSSRAIAFTSIAGDFTQGGTAFNVGGGINYFFSRSAALQVGLNFTSGDFDDGELDGVKQPDTGGSAAGGRLMIGFTWYPMKK